MLNLDKIIAIELPQNTAPYTVTLKEYTTNDAEGTLRLTLVNSDEVEYTVTLRNKATFPEVDKFIAQLRLYYNITATGLATLEHMKTNPVPVMATPGKNPKYTNYSWGNEALKHKPIEIETVSTACEL